MQVEAVERQVTRTVTDTEKVISIELTEEEAFALFAVLGQIVGHRKTDNVRTVVTNALWTEIMTATGVLWSDERVDKYAKHLTSLTVNDD